MSVNVRSDCICTCPVSSRLVSSCPVFSCLVLSCLVLSCLVLSCLVLSCLVLSCLVLSLFLFLSPPLFFPPSILLPPLPQTQHSSKCSNNTCLTQSKRVRVLQVVVNIVVCVLLMLLLVLLLMLDFVLVVVFAFVLVFWLVFSRLCWRFCSWLCFVWLCCHLFMYREWWWWSWCVCCCVPQHCVVLCCGTQQQTRTPWTPTPHCTGKQLQTPWFSFSERNRHIRWIRGWKNTLVFHLQYRVRERERQRHRPTTLRYRRSLNHKPCRLEIGGRLLYDFFSTFWETTRIFDTTQENSPGPDTTRSDRLKALSWICGAVPFLVDGVKLSGYFR